MNPVILIFFLHTSSAAFYEKSDAKDQMYGEVIYHEMSVPSQISCMYICKFRDSKALITYHQGFCQCIRKSVHQEKNKKVSATVSGLFSTKISTYDGITYPVTLHSGACNKKEKAIYLSFQSNFSPFTSACISCYQDFSKFSTNTRLLIPK